MKKQLHQNERKRNILEGLEPLFKRAKKEKLWFSLGGGIWFSPRELKEAHKQDKYIFPAEQWKLRDPIKKSATLWYAVTAATSRFLEFNTRLIKERSR